MRMVIYRCEDEQCFTTFAIEESNEVSRPWCPVCAQDDTIATAELIVGDIRPDSRDW